MKKKTLGLALALAMVLGITAQAAGPWTDTANHWAKLPMAWAMEEGLLKGTSETTLAPDATATRGMAVTVLYRWQGSPDQGTDPIFADVPRDAYYADAVAWANGAGIVTGKTETLFAPNDLVTRQEFVTMLYRWHTAEQGLPQEIGKDNVYTLADFEDADRVAAYGEDAMAWAVGDLFLLGKTQGDARVLSPRDPITRGEMAKILYQYDCMVLGNPGKLFDYQSGAVEKIQVRKGTGPTFFITDPAEIGRFLDRVNGFTYTTQKTALSAGGWYYAFTVFTTDGKSDRVTVTPNGVRVNLDAKGELLYLNEGQSDYFAEAWFASFTPAE